MAMGRRGCIAAVFLLAAAGVYNMGPDVVVEMLHAKSAEAQVQLHALRESMAPQLAAAQLKLHAAQVQAHAFGTSTAKTAGEHLSVAKVKAAEQLAAASEQVVVAKVKAAEQLAAASEQMAVAKVKAAEQLEVAGEHMAAAQVKAAEHLAAAKVQFGVYSAVAEQTLGEYSAIARVKAEEYSNVTRAKAGEYSAITRAKAEEYSAIARVKAEEYSAIARVKAEEYSAAGRIKAEEYSTVARVKAKEYSAVARFKAGAVRQATSQKMDEASVTAQFLYSSAQNVSRTMCAHAFQGAEEFREWLRSEPPAVLLQQLPAKVLSAGRTLMQLMPRDVEAFKALCQTAADTPSLVAGLAFLVALALGRLVFCRHRRQAPVPAVQLQLQRPRYLQTDIFEDPAPSSAQMRANVTQRRRRSDSPGAVAQHRGGASAENRDPAAEQKLLWRINDATPDELYAISGLGDKTVDKILKYRLKHGEVEKMSDFVDKVGMHPAVFANFAKAQMVH